MNIHALVSTLKFSSAYAEIVALLLLATVLGGIALRLRQPLIIGFIGVGVLAGPSVLGWTSSAEEVEILAGLGLSLLLFVVGLKLDLGLIRSTGSVALITGISQVVVTAFLGFGIAMLLGMSLLTSAYVAMALTFSSTIIIVKLLSDRRETDSLHGRITVGLLIVQDIVVVMVMIALAALSGTGDENPARDILFTAARGIGMLAVLGLMMYFILPKMLDVLAKSVELLVLFGIAWAVSLSALSSYLGFSKEVGAFLAGVSLASTPYREILGARLHSLRDFMLLFFFIDLGTHLNLGEMGNRILMAVPLIAFVLLGKPVIVMAVMGALGYRKRTSTLAGLLTAQISEFSLILGALGLTLGHISEETMGLITLVGLVTIGVSTQMISKSRGIYERISPYLHGFERRISHREASADSAHRLTQQPEVILFGLGHYGSRIAEQLVDQGRRVLAVDFDPQEVKRWTAKGGDAWFGDAEDPEFPSMLPLSHARWVISTVPDRSVNKTLLCCLREHEFTGSTAVVAWSPPMAEDLSADGARIVFQPFSDAATQAVDLVNAVDEEERKKRMDKIIAKMKDHYIVCGFGRMGQQVVRDFRRQNVPHVVVEYNEQWFPQLIEEDIPYVGGQASDDKVLLEAGIERARGLVAVNPTDEDNVFIVLTARGLNPNLFIVARSILQENEVKLQRAGADRVLSPYILGGHRIASAVLSPRAVEFLDLLEQDHGTEVEIADISVTAASPFVGKSLAESNLRRTCGVTVLAIKHPSGENLVNPCANYIIHDGDELIIMGSSAQIDDAERLARGNG